MLEALVVSNRGQITLPAAIRKRFGIKNSDVMLPDDRDGEITLKPGITISIHRYRSPPRTTRTGKPL